MTFLSELRDKIEAYARETGPLGFSRQSVNEKDIAGWMRYLEKNRIPFSGGPMYGEYASFRDIDFRGPEIVHQEWRAQLNRFFWLKPLALTYSRTREERWARLARESIEAWMDFRSYDGTETVAGVWRDFGDNSLSCSIRLGQGKLSGWWGCVPYFEGSPSFDGAFIERMRASTADQLHYLRRNVTRNGNFRISQMDTFVFLGMILPEGKPYMKWAAEELNTVFRMQVGADGSHVEHTSGYHRWMCDVFLQYAFLAKAHPELGLRIDPERLSGMMRYTWLHMTPDGGNWGLGDSDCWKPGSDPGAREDYRNRFHAVRKAFGLPPAGIEQSAFPDAGQYVMHAPETSFLLDATNWGGFHCHTGRGALDCFSRGEMLLCDPGSFTYERSDPFMKAGRMTPMHNTVTVNGMSQSAGADARVTGFADSAETAFARCIYAGGWTTAPTQVWDPYPAESMRSVGGRHVRTFLWLKERFALALDCVEVLAPEASYAAHWQLSPGEAEYDEEARRTVIRRGEAGLALTAAWSGGTGTTPVTSGGTASTTRTADGSVRTACVCGDEERMLGFIAADRSRLSRAKPAPMFIAEGRVRGGERGMLLTVLQTFGARDTPAAVAAEGDVTDGVLRLCITVGGERYALAADVTFLSGEMNIASAGEADEKSGMPGSRAPLVLEGGGIRFEAE